MQIIDAQWDFEVLGVKSVELRCEANDSYASIMETVNGLAATYEYMVVKVPVLHREINQNLPQSKFNFIETLISVERSVKSSTLDPRLSQKAAGLTTKIANAGEILHVRDQLMKGIFLTDRIALDQKFGPHVSAKRYWNWIQAEIELGAVVYFVTLPNSSPVGFFTLRVTDKKIAHSVLSGVFDAQNTPGMGLVLLFLILQKAGENGAKKITSAISSNNLPVVRTHIQLGFEVKDMNYVYIHHVSKERDQLNV